MCHRRVLDVGMGNATHFLLSKSGSVGITVASQQEGPRFESWLSQETFLYGFPLGALVSPTI